MSRLLILPQADSAVVRTDFDERSTGADVEV